MTREPLASPSRSFDLQAAALPPAWRASQMTPVEALRFER